MSCDGNMSFPSKPDIHLFNYNGTRLFEIQIFDIKIKVY